MEQQTIESQRLAVLIDHAFCKALATYDQIGLETLWMLCPERREAFINIIDETEDQSWTKDSRIIMTRIIEA